MSDYGPRPVSRAIKLADRTWNDARGDLQNLLEEVVRVSDVANILIEQFQISEENGETIVEPVDGGDDDAMMLMGA